MLKSNRSERSRYYGDFRGVDFSSDHTLVNDSRFPYLVNMYKDYASGGGQGIETIPGFRRRFVAPNGGRIHGIHSFKDKGGKRRVYVHAGQSLYDWRTFPAETGFSKEVSVVAKEYDEYSSSIEGVGIAVDYVQVEIDCDPCVSLDIRAIRALNGSWISIYSGTIYYDEESILKGKDVLRMSEAYSFTQKYNSSGESVGVVMKFPKIIKDSSGAVVAQFAAGDSVQVCGFKASKISMGDQGEGSLQKSGVSYTEKTVNGDGIYCFTYPEGSYPPLYYTPTSIRNGEGNVTIIKDTAISPDLYSKCELSEATLLKEIVADDGTILPPFKPNRGLNSEYNVYLIAKDGAYYFLGADGSRIKAESTDTFKLKGIINNVRLGGLSQYTTHTVLEYDEYLEGGATDYISIADPSTDASLFIKSITKKDGTKITEYTRYGDGTILVEASLLSAGDEVTITYNKEEVVELSSDMNERESQSFVFNNRLYVLDGENYLCVDVTPGTDDTAEVTEAKLVKDGAYIPTTYINIVVGGENADAGKELEPRNILQPKFKHTFIADGETTEYHMNENKLDGIAEVKVYGEVLEESDYKVDLVNGKITFTTAPGKPEDVEMSEGVKYPEAYAGVEITAIKGVYPAIEGDGTTTNGEFVSMINQATIATVFDNRVFFSGIPKRPNLIFWSSLKDPTYIGILNYVQDGSGTTPITAMMRVANSLLVLKADTEQEGAIYYHTPYETGNDVMPKTYPSEAGLAGIGCLGAACNFLDDPVYISRIGLEAIGYRSLQNERSKEHRSSLIDAKLTNLENLKDAKLCEWGGYLVLLVDGKIFLADSRQVFQNNRGEREYEWYYLEDIGVFEGQYDREKYINEWPEMFRGENGERLALKVTYEGKEYTVQLVSDVLVDDPPTEVAEGVPVVAAQVELYGNTYYYDAAIYSVGGTPAYAFLCDGDGEKIGGSFCPAVVVKSIEEGRYENLFFGTTNGVVCSFNFDQRGADGAIPADFYTFNGRSILSGCALKMDNCGIPHMTKTTVKKSTVIKVKSFQSTAAKVRVRTNKNPYNEIARINATRFSFDNLDFSDFSFVVGEDSLFAVREKEKKWVEKQYYIYSDEYKKPFALLYVAFQYYVAGKFKK